MVMVLALNWDYLMEFVLTGVCFLRQQALFHVLTAYSMYNTVSYSVHSEVIPLKAFHNTVHH